MGDELYKSIWELIQPEYIEDNQQICCDNQKKYNNDEFIVCENCGVILEQILNDNKEYAFLNNDGEKSKTSERCGSGINPLIPQMSMHSTVISGNGNLARIQKWVNNSAISYSEKVLMKLKYKINEIVTIYNITGDVSTAILYKIKELIQIKEKKSIIHRGKIYTGLIACCFYYSCKENEYNIPPISIAEMFEIDIKTFNKCCDIYTDLTSTNNTGNEGNVIIDINNSLIRRFFGSLNLSNKFLSLGIDIMTSAEHLYITQGISPQSNIAGLLEFLNIKLDLDISCDKISQIAKVKNSTVKKNAKLYLDNELKIYNYMKFHLIK
jgi:transcription initiation factor TFIIIB Brf1 subunit/transcription initiation factor TFIIB